MEVPEFIAKEKIEVFWKIYNYSCYIAGCEEMLEYEQTSIDCMQELGYKLTAKEKKYLLEYPDKYAEEYMKSKNLGFDIC